MIETPNSKNAHGNQLLSMTGYGKAVGSFGSFELEVELRSVNSRFLDLVLKLPANYLCFESKVRECLQRKLQRGRVEVFVKRNSLSSAALSTSTNSAVIAGLMKAYEDQAQALHCWDESFKQQSLLQILKSREAFSESEPTGNQVEELAALIQIVDQALDQLIGQRALEGQGISQVMKELGAKISSITQEIKNEQPALNEKIKQRLFERLKVLLDEGVIDPQRLTMEAALLADRADIAEEISRLTSHLALFTQNLEQQPQGKKLEFIGQEIGREINTIGAKVQNSSIQTKVVEAKSCLEKIREQCANVE